jgi:hypothetical protein
MSGMNRNVRIRPRCGLITLRPRHRTQARFEDVVALTPANTTFRHMEVLSLFSKKWTVHIGDRGAESNQ